MKNILVTGITGFLGSNLAKYLNNLQKPDGRLNIVGIFRDKDKRKLNNIKDIDIVLCSGDLADYNFVDSVINKYEIDTIFHLGAISIVRVSERSPVRTFETNIQGTWNVLESARQNKTVKAILCMSSDKAYGHVNHLPYKENMALNPKAVYETSKTCADYLCQMYGHNYNLPVIVIRCCNLFGPGDYNFSRIVPNSVIKILDGERPIIWQGVNKYIREFIYVEDAVAMMINLVQKLETSRSGYLVGLPINIGTGVTYKIEDFINLICEVAETELTADIREKDLPFLEIERQFLDLNRLVSILGTTLFNFFNSTKSDIKGCLKQTILWYKENY